MAITEPDVTFTDYGLSIECALFGYLIYRQNHWHRQLQAGFMLFFISLGLASLFGGTVHGFFPDSGTFGHRLLWTLTLVALGVTASSAWMTGATLVSLSRQTLWWFQKIVVLGFVLYSLILIFAAQEFWIAIANYLPATVFLLFAFWIRYRRKQEPAMLIGTVGLLLTFVAAGVQVAAITPHPIYFNHNALYHLIQAVALLLIFWGAKGINFTEDIA